MKLEVKKKTAAKVLGIFFLAMAVCTFLSRAAASMTVPLADIQKVKEGKLSTLLTGEGVIEAKEEKLLSLESGLRMKSVLQAGSRVQKGDTLAEAAAAWPLGKPAAFPRPAGRHAGHHPG